MHVGESLSAMYDSRACRLRKRIPPVRVASLASLGGPASSSLRSMANDRPSHRRRSFSCRVRRRGPHSHDRAVLRRATDPPGPTRPVAQGLPFLARSPVGKEEEEEKGGRTVVSRPRRRRWPPPRWGQVGRARSTPLCRPAEAAEIG